MPGNETAKASLACPVQLDPELLQNVLCAGLRSKEENMRELVCLAEVREAQAKEQMTALLDNRSNMFQSQNAASEAESDFGSIEQHIEEAQRTKALAKKKFNKARSACIGAHQVTLPNVSCLLPKCCCCCCCCCCWVHCLSTCFGTSC